MVMRIATANTSKVTFSKTKFKEQNIINLADIDVEGLGEHREKWRDICIEGSEAEIEQATAEYIKRIEESLNQPISVILKKSGFMEFNDTVLIDRDPGKNAMLRMRDEDATGKSLHEKAKSSVHGKSLAGYIPFNQTFGKAGDSGQTERFNKIVQDRFAAQALDEKKINEFLDIENEGKLLSFKQQKELDTILAKNLVIKDQLKDPIGREIYGYREKDVEPVFAYKLESGEYINEDTGEELLSPYSEMLEKIEVISYITGIEKNSQGKFQLKVQKITGDHDQLAIGIKDKRSKTFKDKVLSGDKGFADEAGHAVTTALIEETKNSGAVRHGQDSGGSGSKDSLSMSELKMIGKKILCSSSLKSFLSGRDIKKIISHKLGGNPFPEDFASGNYAVYSPDGKISVAHNEKQIINQYNKFEAIGYNIGINPRYGWYRNNKNKLELDTHKISAQSFIKARTNNEIEIYNNFPKKFSHKRKTVITLEAHKAADNLYKLYSITALVKLQNNSAERDAIILISNNMLKKAERKYVKEFNVMPPTILAMVNNEQKEQRLNEFKELIVSQSEAKISRRRSKSFSEIPSFVINSSLEKVKDILISSYRKKSSARITSDSNRVNRSKSI